MWIEYNNNPLQRRVGDCAVRSIALALGTDWETAFTLLSDAAYAMCDMPSSDATWAAVLRQHGFYRSAISDLCPDCYTAEEFCEDHPTGKYILVFNEHTACVEDGSLYDAWDSSLETPMYYWYLK